MPVRTVAVVHNVTTDPGNRCMETVRQFLEHHGVGVILIPVVSKDCPVVPPDMATPDLVIVLGGDGTFLRAARCFVTQGVPLVGVNTGTLGFLTRIEADNLSRSLQRVVDGRYEIEERMMLTVAGASLIPDQLALNDVVVKSSNPSQMASMRLYINETLVADYGADGLILATPTGSTAYTLAAGGPVLSPEVEAISMTPICPHSLSAKPVVLPANKILRIESTMKDRDLVCAVDGQDSGSLKPGESLTITRAPVALQLVNFQEEEDNFYRLLKKKLDWAKNPRTEKA